jgi:hypothetical protein
MADLLLFLAILIPALLLGTTLAVAPAVALSFYLAPNPTTARRNICAGMAGAIIGTFLGGLTFDPVARTPPAQAYVIVGAWLGGSLGVGIALALQFLTNRREFRVTRSPRSWLVLLALVSLACALVAFVWSRQW